MKKLYLFAILFLCLQMNHFQIHSQTSYNNSRKTINTKKNSYTLNYLSENYKIPYSRHPNGRDTSTDCTDGTVLFKEDFGGNSTSDPEIRTSGISQVVGYTYSTTSMGSGKYCIRKKGYLNGTQWHIKDDHTYTDDYSRGYFLQVDASSSAGQFYTTTITGLCAGTTVYFSAWAANVMTLVTQNNLENKGYTVAYPNLSFLIKNSSGTQLLKYDTGDIPNDTTPGISYSDPGYWIQYGTYFTVPDSITSLTFSIINNAQNGIGADFTLDDIEIRLCVPPATITASPNDTLCDTEKLILTSNFTNDGTFSEPLEYKWFKKDEATGDWSAVATGITLFFDPVTQSDRGYYRVAVSCAESIDSEYCRSMSDSVYIKPYTCVALTDSFCDGTIYNFEGNKIADAGVYIDTVVYASGTDSIKTITLTKLRADTTIISAVIFDGETYDFGGNFITTAGTYSDLLTNSNGCDSLVVLNLSVVSMQSAQYIACSGADVVLEVLEETGNTYSWYSEQTDGTLLGTGASYTIEKTNAETDTVWLKMNDAERLPVYVFLSAYCESYTEVACTDGTILFNEDFGGNDSTDAECGEAISQVEGYTYDCEPTTGSNIYNLRKTSYPRASWQTMDDHTYPNDMERGYLLFVDANARAGQFYEYTMNNLCAGTNLSFSAWMTSIVISWAGDRTNIIFELYDANDSCISKYYTGDLPDKDPVWKQYGFDFTVPEDMTSLTLKIINNGTGSSGNDFVMDDVEIRLCVPPVTAEISPQDTICEGDSIRLSSRFTNDGSFTEPLEYKWLRKTTGNINWSEFSTDSAVSISKATLSDQGYYRIVVSGTGSIDNENCRAMSDSLFLKVNSCVAVTDSFCAGSEYIFNDDTLTYAGIYTDTLITTQGNDSIITLSLKEMLPDTTTVFASIFNGQSYIFNEDTLTASGTYYNRLTNSNGCDSLIVLNLSVISVQSNQYTGCPGANVELEILEEIGTTYSWYSEETNGTLLGSGTSLIYTKSDEAVDTVWLQVNAERLPLYVYQSDYCGSYTETACPDGTILFKEDFGGNDSTDAVCGNAISQVIGYTFSCSPVGYGLYSISKYTVERTVWALMYDHTYPDDSERGYLLFVDANAGNGQFYEYQIDGLCEGANLSFSAWMSSITVNYLATDKTNAVFELYDTDGNCISKYYTGDLPDNDPEWKQYGFDFTVPEGMSSLILKIINNGTGSAGNDFVMDDIEIRLCVPPVAVEMSPAESCEGDSVKLSAQFTNDGSFSYPLEYKWLRKTIENTGWNEFSTDSAITINAATLSDQGYYRIAVSGTGSIDNENCRAMSDSLFLKMNSCVAVVDSFCAGSEYIFNDDTLTSAGIYTDTLVCASGNDSIITLTLIYKNPVKNTASAQICEGDTYTFGDSMLNESGTYIKTFQNTEGCDSTVTLNLTVIPAEHTAITDSVCENGSYVFNGHTIITSGTYSDTLVASSGCDSIVMLTLTYKQPIKTAVSQQICEDDTYNFGDSELDESGTYTKTFQTTEGCDSTVTLNLMVINKINVSINDSYCEDGSYSFGDELLTSPGTYTQTYVSSQGCDSIVTLILTSEHLDSTILYISIETGDSYYFAGEDLTSSGTYTEVFQSVMGCDSTVVLYLTVAGNPFIPQIFTPNGDGINDYFVISNLDNFPDNEILILNRWGNKVFQAKPYNNDWDGRNHHGVNAGGDELPVGTYFYILDLGDGSKAIKGYIYLNR